MKKLQYLCIVKLKETMIEDFNDIEVPEELGYEMLSQDVYKNISKKWKELKKSLAKVELNENTQQQLEDFDKLLNYFLI